MSVFFTRRGEPPATFDAIFANNSWKKIIFACQSGSVPDSWVVGDSKSMTINGADYQIDIIGKNHDTYTAGGTAPLTFQMHDCYATAYPMNSTNTNVGGWTDCAMRNTHLPAILALMPTEVQNGIREVNKRTSAGSQSSTINTTADKLFLLSEVETYPSINLSVSGEGRRYEYYREVFTSSVKKINGEYVSHWTRSPVRVSGSTFVFVYSGGGASIGNAYERYYIAPAFCF